MRLFTDVLRDLERGRLVDDLTTEIHKVVEAVDETGKAGKVKLELAIKRNGDGQMTVTPKFASDVPQPTRADSFFFVSPEGDLVRNDPRQTEMTLAQDREASNG